MQKGEKMVLHLDNPSRNCILSVASGTSDREVLRLAHRPDLSPGDFCLLGHLKMPWIDQATEMLSELSESMM
jgi:hypothetical protein